MSADLDYVAAIKDADSFRKLKEDAAMGLDMSPGNSNSAWAVQEIETLRERVAKLNGWLNEHESHLSKSRCETESANRKLKAEEAREAELAGAISAENLAWTLGERRSWLEHRHDVFCAQMQGTFDEMPTNRIDEIVQQCEDVLAVTPAEALERARAKDWKLITESHPPAHETVLFLCSNGDIYQGRGCYGLHEPWWCGHSELNFGKIFSDEGLTVTHWKSREALGKEKDSETKT